MKSIQIKESDHRNNKSSKQNNNHSQIWLKMFICYLYIVQGFFYGFYQSIPLSYSSIPSYNILSLFSFAATPFTYKFLIAPFEEKYTSRKYGKRKTWIIVSLTICVFLLGIFSTIVSKSQHQYSAALILFGCIFVIAVKDVATDSLAIEEVSDPGTVGIISFGGAELGKFVTKTLFLAVISKDLWSGYDLQGGLISPSAFMLGIASIILLSIPIIHFTYKQQIHPAQTPSFLKLIFHYKHFFSPKSTLFRQTLSLFTLYHGFLYFTETYQVQMIKKGLHKQILSFISNICVVISFCVSLGINFYIGDVGWYKLRRLLVRIRVIYCCGMYFSLWFFWDQKLIIALFCGEKVLSSVQYYIDCSIINQVAQGNQFSAITVTVLYSALNAGRISVIQMLLIGQFGYHQCVVFGLIYAGVVAAYAEKIEQWIKNGVKIEEKVQSKQQ